MDEKIQKNGLTFRAGETGFVFYDDSRFTAEIGRTWAFGTVHDAAEWLVAQFAPMPDHAANGDDVATMIHRFDKAGVKLPSWVDLSSQKTDASGDESIVLTHRMTEHLIRLLDAQAKTLDTRHDFDPTVLKPLRDMLVRDQRKR